MALSGCGGSGGGSSSASPSLKVSPLSANVAAGQTAIFTASVKGTSDTVLWKVVGGSANGTIAADGTYTAPATPGSYTVEAYLQNHPAVTATATAVAGGAVSVAITPLASTTTVIPLSRIQFAATVADTSNQSVTWSVNGSPVNIDTTGTFTPQAVGTYTVQARSVADPSKTATTQITVVANAYVVFNFLNLGAVTLAVRPDVAPITSANLVSLVNASFYNGIYVHRLVNSGIFIVQWGDPLTKTLPLTDPSIGTGGPGYTIPFETNSLLNVQGSLAMARSSDLNSGGSQIYINLQDNPSLDGSYCVFGSVVDGMSVVNQLVVGSQITTAFTEPTTTTLMAKHR